MSRRTLRLITLLFLAVAFAWTRDRTRPFIGHHDEDDVNWVSAAENYRRYGLWETRLQPIMNPVRVPRQAWSVNQHHPPGISLITYAGLELFGSHEFAVRMVPLAASAVAAALLFRLARRWYGTSTALLGLFFFAFTPLMIYYSAKIGHEQYTLPLMLLTLILYPRRLSPSAKAGGGLPIVLFALGLGGSFISWAWLLFLALLALYTLAVHGRRGLRRSWPLWAGGVGGAVGIIALMAWQQSTFASTLRGAFEERTTNAAGASISLSAWLRTVPPTVLWLPTPVVTAFALLGLHHHRWTADRGLLAVLALTGAIYSLVFWKATYYHDYLIYYLVPPLCVWASVGFQKALYAYGQPPKLLWRGALGLALVTFGISSAHSAARLFATDTFSQRYLWGITAARATGPDEVIVTNLPEIGAHLGYYARRSVQDGIPPDQVISDTRPAEWGFYIYFQRRDQGPPAWLDSFTYQYDRASGCYLIDLK
jgi:4-amino-4-deoxy-L-arabinose transferase-like glycosyltransferase